VQVPGSSGTDGYDGPFATRLLEKIVAHEICSFDVDLLMKVRGPPVGLRMLKWRSHDRVDTECLQDKKRANTSETQPHG
jgi:hypothetical protein